MFKTLAALAQHSPVHVVVLREGEKVRTNINRKPDPKCDVEAISLSLLVSPEELDTELPLALAEAFLKASAPISIADQIKAQAPQSHGEGEGAETRTALTTPKVAPKTEKPAKKPRAKRAPKAAPAAAEPPTAPPKKRGGRKPRQVTAPILTPTIPANTGVPVIAPEYHPPQPAGGETTEASPPMVDPQPPQSAAAPAISRDTSTLDLF